MPLSAVGEKQRRKIVMCAHLAAYTPSNSEHAMIDEGMAGLRSTACRRRLHDLRSVFQVKRGCCTTLPPDAPSARPPPAVPTM